MKKDPIIEINNLNYKNIIHDLNMKIDKNKIIAISGPNSAGKTTLLKIINTLITTENKILYKQKAIEKINKCELFSEISIILKDNPVNFIQSTVEDEILSTSTNLNQEKKYKQLVKSLNFEEKLIENPNNLTEYERIKMLLIISLISNPQVLLLDDICSNMTKNERKDILKYLKNLNKTTKITIIMTTSNLNDTIESDYLYILNKGTIALEGKPLDVLKNDNTINRLGLDIPFMLDLSVKLKDYNLVKNIILDMDRMVDKLWK